jgi:transcriptional regulator of heat shock response
MRTLSNRQQSILNRVVDTHIETAQPVGSKFITGLYTELYRASYSPATVRHEMGLLEEMGYLTHPHTSAGRIPTDRGYRYYVEHSLQQETVPSKVLHQMSEDLTKDSDEFDSFAEKAAGMLSSLSQEMSLMVFEKKSVHGKSKRLKVFLQGSSLILEKPEFRDLETIRLLLKAIEEKRELVEWLKESTASSGVCVKIGRENEHKAFENCSVVATRYIVAGESCGTLAVIGPRRTRYSKTIPLVVEMGQMINRIFDREEEM